MNKKTLKIEGMTCSACANRIEKVIGKLDGVEEANVNFATESLNVSFDENKLSDNDIENAVVKAGYGVKKNLKTYTFKIEGMTCSAAQKVEGVKSSSVNFATEKLTVSIDEDQVGYGEIKAAVDKAGYKLVKEGKKQKEKKRWKRVRCY